MFSLVFHFCICFLIIYHFSCKERDASKILQVEKLKRLPYAKQLEITLTGMIMSSEIERVLSVLSQRSQKIDL